jgi:hypothetical protein
MLMWNCLPSKILVFSLSNKPSMKIIKKVICVNLCNIRIGKKKYSANEITTVIVYENKNIQNVNISFVFIELLYCKGL